MEINKFHFSILFAILALLLSAAPARMSAAAPARAKGTIFHPESAAFEALPMEYAGDVPLVPLRTTFESLGFYVSWDEQRQTFCAWRDIRHIRTWVGLETAVVDGEKVDMEAPCLFVEGVVYAPLSFVLKAAAPVVSGNIEGDFKLWDASVFAKNHGWALLGGGLVAHAGGGFLGRTYLNVMEALEHSYRAGHRVFEMDFNLTSDGKLAAVHDWNGYGGRLSAEKWRTVKVAGLYEPLLIEDVFRFMLAHGDAFLVTDTKSFDYSEEEVKTQFAELVSAARLADPALLKRIVPQVYDRHCYEIVKAAYAFDSVIYTLYASPDSDGEVLDFVAAHEDVKAVTMSRERDPAGALLRKLNALGKHVYYFTENDKADVERFQKQGVHGFYTDLLTP